MSLNIAIVQFPGSNTERETFMACERSGLNPVEFLWNKKHSSLVAFDGFIIVGGFSYEDRSRSGVIASLDPVVNIIKKEAEKGKPVLGICNGAQILVESGMVPGIKNYFVASALTNNKRIVNEEILGTGYYNSWAYLSCSIDPGESAFTSLLSAGENLHVPFAHAEGRFVVPESLLPILINNNQIPFRYSDNRGNIINEFPTNPNGSVYNIAAICNPPGNVMAIMPHPERTTNGDKIFLSIEESLPLAVWQNKGKFSLIDDQGDIVSNVDLKKFKDLMVVVGEGAAKNTAKLFSLLASQPELKRLVKTAIWIGGRRWNLRMLEEIKVRLPEKNADDALARLAEYEKSHRILGQNIKTVDLRFPDRLVINKGPKKTSINVILGQET